MTYKQWSSEYYDSAVKVKERIDTLKREMKTAAADKLAELSNRINILTDMYYECMDIARLLGKRQGEC